MTNYSYFPIGVPAEMPVVSWTDPGHDDIETHCHVLEQHHHVHQPGPLVRCNGSCATLIILPEGQERVRYRKMPRYNTRTQVIMLALWFTYVPISFLVIGPLHASWWRVLIFSVLCGLGYGEAVLLPTFRWVGRRFNL